MSKKVNSATAKTSSSSSSKSGVFSSFASRFSFSSLQSFDEVKSKELWEAAHQNQLEKLKSLLATCGPRLNVNWQDPEHERSPFLRACYFGHLDIVRELAKDPRTNVNLVQGQGATPFYLACQEGNLHIVRELLKDPRVDTLKPAEDSMTPFFAATLGGHSHVVEYILAACPVVDTLSKPVGAYSEVRDKTPEAIALMTGLQPLAALIRSYNENPAVVRSQLQRKFGLQGMTLNCKLQP